MVRDRGRNEVWGWGGGLRHLATILAFIALLTPGSVAAEQWGYALNVYKSQRRMELWHNDALLREFETALGVNPAGNKEMQGDKRTPVGLYYVVEKHVSPRFHRFIGLSYPNVEDANRGYEDGAISARQWADLFVAEERGAAPNPATRLGGRIGIHGFGWRPYIPVIDWTDGCIAISNEEAEYLYSRLPIGTPVMIHD